MKTEEIQYESAYLSSRPPPKIVLKAAWHVRREDHSVVQMNKVPTSNAGTPAAKTRSGKCAVKSISKQTKNSMSSTARPVAKATQIHIFGKLDVKVIKKQMKADLTSSGETCGEGEHEKHLKVDYRI